MFIFNINISTREMTDHYIKYTYNQYKVENFVFKLKINYSFIFVRTHKTIIIKLYWLLIERQFKKENCIYYIKVDYIFI